MLLKRYEVHLKAMKNKYTPQQVDYAFADMNEIGDDRRMPLAKALSILERDLIDKLAEEVRFICCHSGIFGFQLRLKSEYLKGKKAVIFLSEEVFKGEEEEIRHTILHETAHYVLKHKCLFDFSIGEEDKLEAQEVEADALMRKWLKEA